MRKNVALLLSGLGDFIMQGTEEAELLNAFFALDFPSQTGIQESQVPATMSEDWNKEDVSFMEEELLKGSEDA